MERKAKVAIKVESPERECWERSVCLEADEWELILNLVKHMNEDPDIEKREKPWNPADEIAIGFLCVGIQKRKAGESIGKDKE